jgi:hypothetical protein
MKIHAQEMFKRHFQFITFILLALLNVITIIFVFTSMSDKRDLKIIAIDPNGTRLVTTQEDPIFKTEAIAFIQQFFFSAYNFNQENFFKRVGFITTLMTEELWKKKEQEILALKDKVSRDSIEVSSELQKLTRTEDGKFHGQIKLKEKSRLNVTEHLLQVTISLKAVPRTTQNPFGLEVESYEESLITH